MKPEDVFDWLLARPFQPFRIHLVGGRTFDVRHPEMMKVYRTSALVFSYAGESTSQVEHMEMIGLSLIESIEPLATINPAEA